MSLLTEDRRCFRHRRLDSHPAAEAAAEAEEGAVAEAAKVGIPDPWESLSHPDKS